MYRYAERCGWMFHGVDDGGGAQSRDCDADGDNCVIVNNGWVL